MAWPFTTVNTICVSTQSRHFAGNVIAYGGKDNKNIPLASVEMLSPGKAWQTLTWPMYKADYSFATVVLP
jgi:hypothetical protein